MTTKTVQIEKEAIRLPVRDREELAERLIQSLDHVPLTGVEEAWGQEAERRFSAWRRGEREGIPTARAFKQIRKDFGW